MVHDQYREVVQNKSDTQMAVKIKTEWLSNIAHSYITKYKTQEKQYNKMSNY